MPRGSDRVNRGPAAAAGNREAILEAARRLFAREGFRVPLKSVAREAGVGPGVLYRHFPTRLDLAFAVFEENFSALERAAASPDDVVFARLWETIVTQTVESVAFVEAVVEARRTVLDYDGDARLRLLLAGVIARGQVAGSVPRSLTVDDVLLAWRMIFGVVVTAVEPTDLDTGVARAGALLGLP